MSVWPLSFWIGCLLTLLFVWEALVRWREPWARPAIAVYVTVATWYLGNFLYSGAEHFAQLFSRETVDAALFEYDLFCLGYRLFVAVSSATFVSRLPNRSLDVITFSPQYLSQFFSVLIKIWAGLFIFGLWRTGWEVMAVVLPPIAGWKASLFPQEALGSGLTFLGAAAGYIYLLICSAFGIFFALSSGKIRWTAAGMMLLTWPYFLFDRIRNIILAIVMPGIIAYMLLSSARIWKKSMIAVCLIFTINVWFLLVMQYRSTQEFAGFLDTAGIQQKEARHLGLDMLEELCYINNFIISGEYKVNYGQRYWAEIATVVPRTFWPGKPRIGWDYAIARGASLGRTESEGVTATIATGMIGQGVVNFGRFFGVLSSALLMALWTGVLARLWCQRAQLPRALLFLVGAGLTFNMGRDITLLVVWPFVFGYLGVLLWERNLSKHGMPITTGASREVPNETRVRSSLNRRSRHATLAGKLRSRPRQFPRTNPLNSEQGSVHQSNQH